MGKTDRVTRRNWPALLHQISWAFCLHSYNVRGGKPSWNVASGAEGPAETELAVPLQGIPVTEQAGPSMSVM